MTEVRLEGIGKRYGRTVALQDVDLVMRSGELTTLVGPSGCGKSTLLAIIAGLESASSGHVRFDGETVDERSPRERDVAVVFQGYALYPHMRVAENIAFPLRNAGVPKAEREARVVETARSLHIEELLGRKPRQLSGGQRQRVALARAMVRRPRLFLFDEPLSNLDARLRVSMRAEIKRLHRELGATFVYVTHDQTEAMTLSDRLAILNEGRVVQAGTPLEVWDRPASTFVARFVGAVPMNLLPARAGGDALVLGERALPRPPALAADAPTELLLGLRAEDLELTGDPAAAPALEGRVDLAEPLGAEWHLHVATAAGEVVLRRERPAGVGEPVRLTWRWEAAHWFGAEGGTRLP